MKQTLLLFLTVVIFSSCTNTKKFNRFVTDRYPNHSHTSYDYKSDFLNVNTNNIIGQDSLCETERIEGIIIPVIFYWYWNNTVECIINPKFCADKMAYYLKTDAELLGMKEKLKGSTINISIKALPTSFRYINKGHFLFALLSYVMIYKEGIVPVRENMILDYEIIRNDTVIKKRTIEILDRNEYIKQTGMNSRKNLTWGYIDIYESNLKNQSKEAIMKIIDEI